MEAIYRVSASLLKKKENYKLRRFRYLTAKEKFSTKKLILTLDHVSDTFMRN